MVPVRERMTTGSIAQARVDFYARFSQMGRGHDLVTGVRARVATDHATFSMIAIDTGRLMGIESSPKRAWRPLELLLGLGARAKLSSAEWDARERARDQPRRSTIHATEAVCVELGTRPRPRTPQKLSRPFGIPRARATRASEKASGRILAFGLRKVFPTSADPTVFIYLYTENDGMPSMGSV